MGLAIEITSASAMTVVQLNTEYLQYAVKIFNGQKWNFDFTFFAIAFDRNFRAKVR
jgi:hypothetical protein